jgi:hypothetical protein
MRSIVSTRPLARYRLDVLFDDGFHKVVDLAPFIGDGISAALKDEAFFQQVKVEDGFISWPNGFDICPEALYEYATGVQAILV